MNVQECYEKVIQSTPVLFLSIKYPNHTMNWQNWALILFNMGDYPQAWDRLQSAIKTPRGKEVDPEFVKALSSKIEK